MTPRQKALVVVSFEQLQPFAQETGELFYRHMFALDPDLQRMYSADTRRQACKLIDMLRATVASLSDRADFSANITPVAASHLGYGVRPEHFSVARAALILTLQQQLGARFNPETREAWLLTYDLLAAFMQNAMEADQ